MSTAAATQHAPDLSALTPTERLNIAVHLTQGGEWRRQEQDGGVYWWLEDVDASGLRCPVFGLSSEGEPDNWFLPDYAGDPSAWGALMEKERVWPTPYTDALTGEKTWAGNYPTGEREGAHDTFVYVKRPLSVGEAVAAATLLKHGVDPTPYIGRLKSVDANTEQEKLTREQDYLIADLASRATFEELAVQMEDTTPVDLLGLDSHILRARSLVQLKRFLHRLNTNAP